MDPRGPCSLLGCRYVIFVLSIIAALTHHSSAYFLSRVISTLPHYAFAYQLGGSTIRVCIVNATSLLFCILAALIQLVAVVVVSVVVVVFVAVVAALHSCSEEPIIGT